MADRLEDNHNPIATMFYGFSVFHCMTQSLAQGGPGLGTCMGPAQGAVILSSYEFDPIRLYYIPQNSVVNTNVNIQSRLQRGTGCVNVPSTEVGIPIFPNDPAVTGVDAEFYDLPMVIRHQ